MESADLVMEVCKTLAPLSSRFPFIFKSSFDKANRTSLGSKRGISIRQGLELFKRVKAEFGFAVTTDIHLPDQADMVAEVVDLIQIPAFLCRQTDLILAAATTGLPVHVKKGQFVAPEDMAHTVEKIRSVSDAEIILTERGTCFGYNRLVVDMRSFPILRRTGASIGFDATHSVQLPAAAGGTSSGERWAIPTLAKAAIAAGIDYLFMEIHPDPKHALSDADTQIPLERVEEFLSLFSQLHEAVCQLPRTEPLLVS